jgi:threonine dehydrogenase-like Zn-dependent dehydrogenase
MKGSRFESGGAGGDATERVRELTGGLGAEVVIEAVGVPDTFELCTELVQPGGHVANYPFVEAGWFRPAHPHWAGRSSRSERPPALIYDASERARRRPLR